MRARSGGPLVPSGPGGGSGGAPDVRMRPQWGRLLTCQCCGVTPPPPPADTGTTAVERLIGTAAPVQAEVGGFAGFTNAFVFTRAVASWDNV